MKKVSVVIPTMGLWEKCTYLCLRSVVAPLVDNMLDLGLKTVKKGLYEENDIEVSAIIVDNSPNHETDNHAGDLLNAKVIRNENNTGCSGAWNQGIHLALENGADYIMVINDDVILNKTTIPRLVKFLENPTNDFTVLASAMMVNTKDHAIGRFSNEDFPELDEKVNEHPHFSAFMVRRNFFDIVGEFDQGFFPVYFEDNDMHRRILHAGKRAVMLEDSKFYHIDGGSVTQRELNACPSDRFVRLREYYVKKWGGQPGFESFKTPFNDDSFTYKSAKQTEENWPVK